MRRVDDEEFSFERLEVWQKAFDFSDRLYTLTRSFPREEMFGLTNQLRRGSVSVAANIAEGAWRESGKDRARFYEIATMLRLACRQRFIPDDLLPELRREIGDMCRMLSGLKREALVRSHSTLHTPHSTLNKAEP